MIGKFGLLPTKRDTRNLQLATYLDDGILPAVDAAPDWQVGQPWDSDALGNDLVGCCAYAAPGHAIRLASRIAKLPDPVTSFGVLQAYSDGTGYDPAKPETDQGAYLLDVLKQWRSVGICGTKIEAFVEVREDLVPVAIALFGGVIGGLWLPDDLEHDIWADTSQPGRNGHAEFFFAASPSMWNANTWGIRKSHTPTFAKTYGREWYAVLLAGYPPPPCGLNLEQLRADLEKLK